MKTILKWSFLLCMAYGTESVAQCTVYCTLTQTYICPNTVAWKTNENLYNDVEFMSESYTKEKNGCWRLKGNANYQKIGSKNALTGLYDKLVRAFGKNNVKKTGF